MPPAPSRPPRPPRPSATAYLGLAAGLLVAAVVAVASIVLLGGPEPDLRGLPPFTPGATSTADPGATSTQPGATDPGAPTDAEPTGGTGSTESTEPTESAAPPTSEPPDDGSVLPPGTEPGVLGDDPELDRLAGDCFAGVMDSCDELYFNSLSGSDYDVYGKTCGGRVGYDDFQLCVFYEDSLG